MLETSALYKTIVAKPNHYFEISLTVGDSGVLITKQGERILFGGSAILVDSGTAESGYRMERLISVKTFHALFSNSMPEVGSCVAGEIDVEMLYPAQEFPSRARLGLYARATDGVQYSEWIPQGVYYIDTRERTFNDSGLSILHIHGYDALLLTEQLYPETSDLDYPALDVDIVNSICNAIGIRLDPRSDMDKEYRFPLPVDYTMREVLSSIAAAYGGNFVMTHDGMLRLIGLNDIPAQTNYLIDQAGFAITFGGDRILV